ncbi:FecR family protein [Pedobacter gandavensis]|nr:FecR family protein [Pedobacter gandavensis]
MSEKEFLALYEQYLQGNCTPEEILLLENYQDDFKWKTWTADLGDKERIHDEIYQRLHQEVQPVLQNSGSFRNRWMAAAAAVLITAAGGLLFFNTQKLNLFNESSLNASVFETRTGEKKQIRLQDGTIVWLNAESKLVLAKDYNQERREVDLTGEAYFDVVHSKTKPFKVHTKVFNINVLGTAFNVKAYPTDFNATATLIRGSISMCGLSPDSKQIILKPSEKVVFLNPEKLLNTPGKQQLKSSPNVRIQHYTQRTDTVVVETAWKNNSLEIYDQTFAEIKDILERWYDIEIQFKSKTVENYRFRANYNNESIVDVLQSLQEAHKFKYEMKDRTVTISE